MTADVRSMLIGSDDYPAWRAAVVRAIMGAGPVPQTLPAVMPLHELLDEAEATAGSKPITQPGLTPRPTPKSVVLADLDRLVIAGGNLLTTWVRLVAEERAAEGITDLAPGPATDALCSWLASRHDWIDAQPWADEYRRDVRQLHGHLRQLCRIAAPRPVWRCTVEGCGDVADPQPGGEWMLCRSGHELPGLAAMRRDVAREWVTARQATERYGIPAGTVRYWRHRGWIEPSGRRGHRDLWSTWDLLQVRQVLAMGDTPPAISSEVC